MQPWFKTIGSVKNQFGYAALALLVAMVIMSIIVSKTQEFVLVVTLFISYFIYSLAVIILLIRSLKETKLGGRNNNSQIKTYANIQNAFSDMTPIIEKSILSPKDTNIVVMGLTLYHMWEYIKNFINKPSSDTMNIFLCMVDSSSPIIKDLKNNWDEISDGFYNTIQNYIKLHEEDLKRRSINIQVSRYKHVPIIHGILINDEHLFFSFTSWTKKDLLEGASNFYSYYDLKTQIGEFHIKIFKNWIDHIRKCKCDKLCLESFHNYTFKNNHK
jgi:hypothetical protein